MTVQGQAATAHQQALLATHQIHLTLVQEAVTQKAPQVVHLPQMVEKVRYSMQLMWFFHFEDF